MRKRWRSVVVAALLAGPVWGVEPFSTNLLVNADFSGPTQKDGTPGGWWRYAGGGKQQQLEVVELDDAGKAVLLADGDANSEIGLRQAVPARGGLTYEASVAVRGVMDQGDAYHSYARELVKAGFAVLAPLNLRTQEHRNRIERLCRLADTTLPGIELARVQRLLDAVLQDSRIDAERVGMWGVSLGGMATMFWMPLEPRIKAGIPCAWFNHRRNKMAIPDSRYSCFLETREEHAFFRGWLTEFTDADVVALICPRPLLVQTGKQDRIAHWPQVMEEFEESREHYKKLGLGDRMEMDLHEGGHEARVESGLRFMKHWLMPEKL